MSLESFPDELLFNIFSYLDVEDLALSIQHVCGRWREVSRDPKLWENLVFRPTKGEDESRICSVIEQAPELHSVILEQEVDAPSVVGLMCRSCRDLRRLQFCSEQKLATSVLITLQQHFPDIECVVLAKHEKYSLTYRLPRKYIVRVKTVH